jgi:hypothetical protein
VRVGEPLPVEGRPTREAVTALTEATWAALHALVRDAPEVARPGRVGRWVTDRFNDWPEGSREATAAASPSSIGRTVGAGGSAVAATTEP